MHMSDALLSPAVGATMAVASAGAIIYSIKKMKEDKSFTEKKIPIMGVSGAFVFAAQMINFTIPGTGSSGHIGGGILLAALLGPYPAMLTISCVLMIQCLFFADGGLLALGANIFNMGFWPCLIIYPLLFRTITRCKMNRKRIMTASVVSAVAGLQLGAFSVVLETLASGVTQLPFSVFLLMMQPIHLAIGIVEGLVTGAVLSFVYSSRPEILEASVSETPIAKPVSIKKVVSVLAVLAVITGAGLSWYASAYPDGLEWSMEKVAGTAELKGRTAVHKDAAGIQEKTAVMPDYSSKSDPSRGTSTAGLLGGGICLVVSGLTGFIIYIFKKRKKAVSN